MTEIATQTLEIKPKLSIYFQRVAKIPDYKQNENERITTYIKKRYNEDPEYRQKRLEYQRAYDKAKREAKLALQNQNIVIPDSIPV
jgi:hypothetical protein